MRPLCKICRRKPCALNYYKNNKAYYRTRCESCSNDKKKARSPRWFYRGYTKKDFCEKCGFKSKHCEQFDVYHVDGDLENCRPNNLKTICANCQRILQKTGSKWRQGDLTPDY